MSDNRHGYKAYNPGLVCRGYQYKENEVFKKNGHGICVPGVTHYCVNPFDVLDFYPLVNDEGKFSDFTTVEAIDEPVTDDNKKFATSAIKIGVKLGLDGFVKAAIDFLFEKTIKNMPESNVDSGRYAQIGSSGYAAQIGSSGDAAQIGSSGYAAKIGSSGDAAKIGSAGYAAKIGSSGYAAKIGSSGRYAQIGSSGDDAIVTCGADFAVVACIGKRGKIKAPLGTWITLAEYADYDGEGFPCKCVKSAQIDGEILKADTFYTLKDGEFYEVIGNIQDAPRTEEVKE